MREKRTLSTGAVPSSELQPIAEVQKLQALQVCTMVAGRAAAVPLLPLASWTGPGWHNRYSSELLANALLTVQSSALTASVEGQSRLSHSLGFHKGRNNKSGLTKHVQA